MMFTSTRFPAANNTRPRLNMNNLLHFIGASFVEWFLQALPVVQEVGHVNRMDSRVGSLPSTEDLPTGHTIRPLHEQTRRSSN